ncbi:DUF2799 domain-containing protein [Roseospirillum parvum]|uniref:DUF2799 domain-containing protein n=1 Tax=Roseospirillum parvum TaxID=83401 RepID=A0A1G7TLG3_9PROT|nr:DUF2799 domain-containing protein [Roseospirillum parvum]SDG36041.1 Protein of unknown function [Roseospirillum parvum]
MRLVGVLLTVLLTGCASLSEDECRTADWAAIGYADGAAGRPGSRLEDHREACAEYGIAPVLAAYRAGRGEGLLEYCRPARGYAEGLDGKTYRGVCPAHLEADFVAAHQAGRDIHRLEEEAEDLAAEVTDLDQQLDTLRRRRASLKSAALTGETLEARTNALLRLDDLDTELRRLDNRRADLLVRRVHLEERAFRRRAEAAARWSGKP